MYHPKIAKDRKASLHAFWSLSMPDIRTLETILSNHLPEITIQRLDEMHGGMSGSRVYRVRAQANFPALNVSCNLPSFVIKTSSEDSIMKEATNYGKIPEETKPYFAEIKLNRLYPLPGERVVFYLVMTDLEGFDTLHNAIHVNSIELGLLSRIIDRLYETLKNRIYHAGKLESLKPNKLGIVKSLYLGKMKRTLQDVVKRGLGLERKDVDMIKSYLDDLFRRKIPEPSYLTMVHGDLQAKNIMIRMRGNLPVSIKLIDIDNLVENGDYMYDLGELAAHVLFVGWVFEIDSPFLEITNYSNFNPSAQKRLQAIRKIIDEKTFELANEFGESTDEAKSRYFLSKARFLLTCSLFERKESKAIIYFTEALRNLKECVSTL